MNRAQRRAEERAIARVIANPAKRRTLERLVAADMAARPIAAEAQSEIATFMRMAFDAMCRGDAKLVDLGNIGIAIALTRALAELGYGTEAMEYLEAAESAFIGVQHRFDRLGRIGMTGGEREALSLLIDLHDQQLGLGISQGDMQRAFKVARERTQGAIA